VSTAFHDFSGGPAGNQTNHDPPDNPVSHAILLESSVRVDCCRANAGRVWRGGRVVKPGIPLLIIVGAGEVLDRADAHEHSMAGPTRRCPSPERTHLRS